MGQGRTRGGAPDPKFPSLADVRPTSDGFTVEKILGLLVTLLARVDLGLSGDAVISGVDHFFFRLGRLLLSLGVGRFVMGTEYSRYRTLCCIVTKAVYFVRGT